MYRLVALDLDDTLLGSDLKVEPQTAQVIQQVMDRGIYVTLATGRMFRSSLPYARELRIRGPLITYQGALVKDTETGEVLYHCPVPLELAVDVIRRVREYGYHINLYVDDCLFVARESAEGKRYAAYSRVPLQVVGDLDSFLLAQRKEPTKVLVVAAEELLDELAAALQPTYGASLHITKSKPHFLEFSHPRATKGEALQAVAGRLGVPREEVLAVGDSYNDLEMLAWAGCGVAMGNAREEIKQKADYVTLSNEEGGVRHVLRKFVLGAG